jgi:hypothetical protein
MCTRELCCTEPVSGENAGLSTSKGNPRYNSALMRCSVTALGKAFTERGIKVKFHVATKIKIKLLEKI